MTPFQYHQYGVIISKEITIIERAEQHALCVYENVGTMKLGKVMRPAYQQITDHLNENKISLGENIIPFTMYKNLDWEKINKKGLFSLIDMLFFYKWEMEIGVPCPASVMGVGRIKKKQLQSGKYIRVIHEGSYKKVGNTYKKILDYASEKNLKVENYSIEFYLNDPREIQTSQLETEVLVAIL